MPTRVSSMPSYGLTFGSPYTVTERSGLTTSRIWQLGDSPSGGHWVYGAAGGPAADAEPAMKIAGMLSDKAVAQESRRLKCTRTSIGEILIGPPSDLNRANPYAASPPTRGLLRCLGPIHFRNRDLTPSSMVVPVLGMHRLSLQSLYETQVPSSAHSNMGGYCAAYAMRAACQNCPPLLIVAVAL